MYKHAIAYQNIYLYFGLIQFCDLGESRQIEMTDQRKWLDKEKLAIKRKEKMEIDWKY